MLNHGVTGWPGSVPATTPSPWKLTVIVWAAGAGWFNSALNVNVVCETEMDVSEEPPPPPPHALRLATIHNAHTTYAILAGNPSLLTVPALPFLLQGSV